MWHLIQHSLLLGPASAVALVLLSAFHACSGPDSTSVPPPQRSAAYYFDCSARQNGNGTQASPWNSPASVNGFTFLPGNHLLLKRGTVCNGALNPQGSGNAKSPIVIDAYGTGAQPVINGGSAKGALTLFNQQYWEINNLEITGGNLYGVYVSGNTPNTSINHIYLRNLNVQGTKDFRRSINRNPKP